MPGVERFAELWRIRAEGSDADLAAFWERDGRRGGLLALCMPTAWEWEEMKARRVPAPVTPTRSGDMCITRGYTFQP
jgi:hypothetical protein